MAPDPGAAGRFRDNLVKTRISPDLLAQMDDAAAAVAGPAAVETEAAATEVIIELNADYPGGLAAARQWLVGNYRQNHEVPADIVARLGLVDEAPFADAAMFDAADCLRLRKSLFTETYLFGRVTQATIVHLGAPLEADAPHPIHKLWLDQPMASMIYDSARTVKCDAARIAFGAEGEGLVWAVADTGIDARHPHFALHENLGALPAGVRHFDFTLDDPDDDQAAKGALVDATGHGTHVAGIIAGETRVGEGGVSAILINRKLQQGAGGDVSMPVTDRQVIAGLAPRCALLSLKVLRAESDGTQRAQGSTSSLLAAIGYVQQINGFGRYLKVHGLNLSLGYPFDPQWYAAGQSPLCVEVDRLVRCGVVVVAAAGNAGYGRVTTQQGTSEPAALGGTIADPGNARLAITVGATHRDQPHVYGVSYFSAKGPTADGRRKPDMVAPGERIVSCQAGAVDPSAAGAATGGAGVALFKEDSGTSMAAPHVSGAAAAFLSVRREYLGRPEEVKAILTRSASDLDRQPEFQGAGLLDLMRALQAV